MKAFVIGVKDQQASWSGAKRVAEELSAFGHDAELFEGVPGDQAVYRATKDRRTVYPYSIKSKEDTMEYMRQWIAPERYDEFEAGHYMRIWRRTFLTPEELAKVSKPGVIGCYYSHRELWQRCRDLDEPILIFEDDVKFYRNFEPVEWQDVLILSIGKTVPSTEPYKTYLEQPQGLPRAVEWPNASMPGTSGYAIHPHAAAKLLKFYNNYTCPADNAIHQFVVDIECHNYLMGRHLEESEGNSTLVRSTVWD